MGWSGRLTREDGFTVLELMIVVIIVGVLVGIAVASYGLSVSVSKKTACKANLRIIEEQIVVYNNHYGADPETLQDLVPELIDNEKSLHCPESGEAYLYDSTTGDVSCPYHNDL